MPKKASWDEATTQSRLPRHTRAQYGHEGIVTLTPMATVQFHVATQKSLRILQAVIKVLRGYTAAKMRQWKAARAILETKRRVPVKGRKFQLVQDPSFPPPFAYLVPLLGGTMGLGCETSFGRMYRLELWTTVTKASPQHYNVSGGREELTGGPLAGNSGLSQA